MIMMMKCMKKAQIDLGTLFGLFLVLIIYLVGLYPIIRDTIAGITSIDPITASLLSFVPAAFLVFIIVGLFSYATQRRQMVG